VHPAAHRGRCLLRLVPVAEHDVVAADDDLADLAAGQLVVVGADDGDLDVGRGPARELRQASSPAGEKMYSAEVENALAVHPAVAACAVFGVPDSR
jgi:non-ribosomal peptide synthetase component E (peptide arylation enzyme)